MSDWIKEIAKDEAGKEHSFWTHNDLGSIYRTPDGAYVAFVPRVVKLGPFSTVEEAQQVVEDETNQKALDQQLDSFNMHILDLIKQLKAGA